MVVELVKLKIEHLDQLLAQESMEAMRPFVTEEYKRSLEKGAMSWTVITATGRIAACGGFAEYWPGRAEAWSIFDNTTPCRREFIAIHNAVRNNIERHPTKRLECAVEIGFEAGHRWAIALGFTVEAPLMKAYLPGGKDAALYSKVRE